MSHYNIKFYNFYWESWVGMQLICEMREPFTKPLREKKLIILFPLKFIIMLTMIPKDNSINDWFYIDERLSFVRPQDISP